VVVELGQGCEDMVAIWQLVQRHYKFDESIIQICKGIDSSAKGAPR